MRQVLTRTGAHGIDQGRRHRSRWLREASRRSRQQFQTPSETLHGAPNRPRQPWEILH